MRDRLVFDGKHHRVVPVEERAWLVSLKDLRAIFVSLV